MTENAMKKLNLRAKPTKIGAGLSVYPRNGFVMVIRIVWMGLTRTLRYTAAQHRSLAVKSNLLVAMDGVSTGYVFQHQICIIKLI